MTSAKALLLVSTSMILVGCVPIREIRTSFPPGTGGSSQTADILSAPAPVPSSCDVGGTTSHENTRLIEDYGSYVLGFAEFDDQGWFYGDDAQLTALQRRLQTEVADKTYADMDFAVIVFVHGWHHNAHDNDCNVQEARQMVHIAAQQFDDAYANHLIARKRRVFGIYVGWRGAAEKVAKGSVRQLFANLHEQQLAAQAAASDRKDARDQADRMYTTIVGHSFGGLVVFNSLSQQLINDLTNDVQLYCSSGAADAAGVVSSWPDEVVLINPAFEGTRFEPVNRLADRLAASGYSAPIPLLTVVTADNDHWTGSVFTVARRFLTLFEGYDQSTATSANLERNANLRAIGFVERYRTHRLCLRQRSPSAYATVSPTPAPTSTADPQTISGRAAWVVGAPPDIVNGHDGFLYVRTRAGTPQPYLLDWLLALHVNRADALSGSNTCGSWPH
jgi:pimeloyl-ACP methyl ester carboxylesterase